MPYRLVLLLFLCAELVGLIATGAAIGALPTFGLLIAGMVVGALLLRWRGGATLSRIRADLQARRVPTESAAGGVMTAAAALLLIFPGFLSDLLAILLLLPPVRSRLAAPIGRRFSFGRPGAFRRRSAAATLDLEAGEFISSRQRPAEPREDRSR